jgi:hypothetical protein
MFKPKPGHIIPVSDNAAGQGSGGNGKPLQRAETIAAKLSNNHATLTESRSHIY